MRGKRETSETTQLLLDWADGDEAALHALTPHIYRELRGMAAAFIRRERQEHTLQPTALVHEVYLKLVDVRKAGWKGKAHFYAACAQMMRRILVDAARKRSTTKHGGGLKRVDLDEIPHPNNARSSRLIALDDALNELAKLDRQQSRIVEMRFFGGLSIDETACALNLSPTTVKRHWATARLWLHRQMNNTADL